jgi:hypothetical protein
LINSNLWRSIQQAGHSNNNEQTPPQASQTSTEHTHIIPQVQNSLLSTSKVINADYIAIYDKEEVNLYNQKTKNTTKLEEAVLKG